MNLHKILKESIEKVIKEYHTPDGLKDDDIDYSWEEYAYPFIDTSKGLVYGNEGDKHSDMKYQVVGALTKLKLSQVEDIVNNEYPMLDDYDEEGYMQEIQDEIGVDDDDIEDVYYWFEGEGKYELQDHCYAFGRIWPNVGYDGESYLSFWMNYRCINDEYCDDFYYDDENNEASGQFEVDNNSGDGQINYIPKKITDYHLKVAEEVFNKFKCNLESCYICQGETKLPFLELRDGKKEITFSNDDERKEMEQQRIHLLPPEKKKETPQIQGFLSDRNQKMNKKLSMHDLDGNFKGVMPMAKYNFYKRYGLGDSKIINKDLVEGMKFNNRNLGRILRESIDMVLTESSLNSRKLFDIIQKHGGLGSSSSHLHHKAYGNFENIQDEDVVGVFNRKDLFSLSEKSLREFAKENGISLDPSDDVSTQELRDGKILVYVDRNARFDCVGSKYQKEQTPTDWKTYWDKTQDRERSRRNDGAREYIPSTPKGKAANALRRNPYFWDRKTRRDPNSGWSNPQRRKEALDNAKMGKDAWGYDMR